MEFVGLNVIRCFKQMRTYSPFKFLLGVLGILNSHDTAIEHHSCPSHLDVIGAGLSKTGTQSTKFAFESLGYKVYNVESMMYYGHLDLVTSIYQTQGEERHEKLVEFNSKILETGSTVVLDIPCNLLYKELFELNPDAQVLLTIRDTPQKWTQSIQKTFNAFAPIIGWPYTWFFDIYTYSTLIWSDGCEHHIDIWEPWFMPWVKIAHRHYMTDDDKCRDMYVNHNHNVTDLIPDTQLTTYNVKEGWVPILHMLNLTNYDILPEFPRVNQGSDMNSISFFTRLVAYGYPVLLILIFVLSFYVAVWWMFVSTVCVCAGMGVLGCVK